MYTVAEAITMVGWTGDTCRDMQLYRGKTGGLLPTVFTVNIPSLCSYEQTLVALNPQRQLLLLIPLLPFREPGRNAVSS